MKPSETLAFEVEELLQKQLNWPEGRLEAVFQGAAQILATLSGYITLVTLPQTATAKLRHLQLVRMEADKIMLIIVTNTYETHSLMMDLTPINQTNDRQELSGNLSTLDPEDVDGELQILSNFLNSQLRGRVIGELSTLDWEELDWTFEKYTELITNLFDSLTLRCQTPKYTRILIGGIAEALRLPEFSQLEQVQTIIQLLEEQQEQLWPLIFEATSQKTDKQVTVRIGSENPLEPIQACTLVSATYGNGTIPLGSVGVLGPTRMVYENAIALVKSTADFLSEAIGSY